MRRLPRRILGMITLFTALPFAAALADEGQIQRIQHPVGWERIVRQPLPQPVKAASGATGVYVPRELGRIPTEAGDFIVVDDPVDVLGEPLPRSRPNATESVGSNVRLNNTLGDLSNTTNAETSIAARGLQLVAGWNDGLNFGLSPGNSGYAYSSDGGLTWTDGGVPPAVSPARYQGDPCLAVDNAGNFYYANLYTPGSSLSGLAVNHGTFAGPVFTWGPPVQPVPATGVDFLDKEWLTVDPVIGIVYLTYTRFLAAGGNQIEFTRSLDQGATWDPPTVLTSTLIESVQGSRVAVGPSGEVQVIYFVFDKASSSNFMRARRSTTQGLSWGAEVTLPTGPSGIISNYGSGPAGFNRARGIGFPSLAIDRSGSIHSGRVYATWEETFNFYYDPLGTLGSVAEVEGNDSPGAANALVIGKSVSGVMSSTADQDWFSFSGTAGQKVILYLVPGTGDGFLRLFAGGGGATANRAMLSYIGFGTGLIVYTIPANGTYYLRVLANSTTVGSYVVYTGYDAADPGDEVGRDTRDAILQYSDDGVSWNVRSVVNDDAALYDNAFPEVAVDGTGTVFDYWMDHRNDVAAGILADYYYLYSGSGGVAFSSSAKVNDGPSINWSLVASNLAPNMGDYEGITADGCNIYANFADGRGGTPDSWMATINECVPTATELALVSAEALPNRVLLDWYWASGAGREATVYRREEVSDWSAIASIHADGTGRFVFEDVHVSAGTRYVYRLGLPGGSGETFHGEAWVDVPAEIPLRLAVMNRNPAINDLQVSFALPSAARATLELIDIAGRSVASLEVGSLGAGNHTLRLGADTHLRSGIYIVRLTQGMQSITTKATLIR